MKKIFYLFIMLFFAVTSFGQTIVESHGHLHTDGNKIKDECGRIVELRGLSGYWHFWENGNRYMNGDLYQWLADEWKVQIVRAPIGVEPHSDFGALGTTVNTTACNGDETSIGLTGREYSLLLAKRAIQGAIDAGIYIIFDWHCHYEYRDEAKAFMGELAQEFGDTPNVLWQIFMEPWGDTYSWAQLKDYSMDLTAHLRQWTDQLIIIPSANWNQSLIEPADDPITVDINGNTAYNLVYACHFYTDINEYHNQPLRDKAQYMLDKGLPIILPEVGCHGTWDDTEWDAWVEFMDDNDLSFTKFSICAKEENPSILSHYGASFTGGWTDSDLRVAGLKLRKLFLEQNVNPGLCGPKVDVTGVSVSPTSASLTSLGQTVGLTETVEPSDASNKSVTWTSSDESVATVSSNGTVTAVKNGTTTITVTTDDGGFQATCLVTVEGIQGGVNLLSNGCFDSNLNDWTLYTNTANASASQSNGQAVISISSAGADAWQPQFAQPGFEIVSGGQYTVQLKARAAANRNIQLYVSTGPDSYTAFLNETIALTTSTQEFTYTFTAASNDDNARFDINLGGNNADVYIDYAYIGIGASQEVCDGPVIVPVESVSISPTSHTLTAVGATFQLTETVLPSNATDKSVSWSSDNTAAATVDQNGLVTAVANGVANITVTTNDGGKVATSVITVDIDTDVPVESVSVSPTSSTLTSVGATVQLSETVLPENATDKSVVWESNNDGVATVDQSGVVTAKGEGSANITVTTNDGGKVATSTITVDFPSGGCTISITMRGNCGGEDVKLLVDNVAVATWNDIGNTLTTKSYSGYEGGIIKVEFFNDGNDGCDRNLFVDYIEVDGTTFQTENTAVRTGCGDSQWLWCDGNFDFGNIGCGNTDVPVESVSVSPTSSTLTSVGATVQLSETVLPSNATDKSVSWNSDNTAAATVDQNGLVTAVANGTANITVTTNSGAKVATSVITVEINTIVPVESVSVSPTSSTLTSVGATVQLSETVLPTNATDKSVSWSSDNTAAATVDQNGLVTAVANGIANITVTTNSEAKVATSVITVDIPSNNCDITIRASGNGGGENMELRIDDVTVESWTMVSSFQNYTYTNYSGTHNIKVAFTNDGGYRDLIVDNIKVGDVTYQAETDAVRTGCGSGEWLWCNGYFDFGDIGCGTKSAFINQNQVFSENSQNLFVFPNPTNTNGSFSIVLEGNDDSLVRMYDMQGRLVYKEYTVDLKLNVNKTFESGIYLIQVQDNVKKLIVK